MHQGSVAILSSDVTVLGREALQEVSGDKEGLYPREREGITACAEAGKGHRSSMSLLFLSLLCVTSPSFYDKYKPFHLGPCKLQSYSAFVSVANYPESSILL